MAAKIERHGSMDRYTEIYIYIYIWIHRNIRDAWIPVYRYMDILKHPHIYIYVY